MTSASVTLTLALALALALALPYPKERIELYDEREWLFNMRSAWTPLL